MIQAQGMRPTPDIGVAWDRLDKAVRAVLVADRVPIPIMVELVEARVGMWMAMREWSATVEREG
jgi:hypothetical protein